MVRYRDCPQHCGRKRIAFHRGRGWCINCGRVSIPEPQHLAKPPLQIVRDEEKKKKNKIA